MSIWFPTAPGAAAAEVTLFCFPHGGGDAAAFREWQGGLDALAEPGSPGARIDVAAASLPGRGRRIRDALVPSVAELADQVLAPALERTNGPVALFGHSMGALIAFELAHRLVAAARPPVLLIASGTPAPQCHGAGTPVGTSLGTPVGTPVGTSQLPDAEFLDSVRALGGLPEELLDNPELLELVLPVLRADYAAFEGYRCPQRTVLDVPLLVLGGTDDPSVPHAELAGWCEVTSAAATVRTFPGGHFFLHDALDDVLATVHAALDGVHVPSTPGTGEQQ